MDLAHLSLQSFIFELRYPHAFYLWDRAGRIWADATGRWPELKPREVTPNQTRFMLGNRMEIGVQLERSFVSIAGSKLDLEELLPYSSFLIENVPAVLEILVLTRVGFKVTYLKEYKTTDDAVKDFFRTGLVKEFGTKIFGVDGKIEFPYFNVRFEGEHLGCLATLQVRKRTVTLDVTVIGEEELKPLTRDHVELVFDCDYFTTSSMNVSQLNAELWLQQAMHAIRRDAGQILGG